MNSKKSIFPFVWPWKGLNNESLTFTGWLRSRGFSISYLLVIWSIVGILGFASTRARDCESSWEMGIYCEYAFWVKNLTEEPWVFVRNLITTPFLHNGLDHILFVSIVGFILIVQSHELRFGWKATLFIFLSSYITVAPFFGVFYTVGLDYFPDSHFMQFAFARNWMGGSIGMFQVYGSLATRSRKPWAMLSVPFLFEALNLSLGIDLHISLMHIMSTLLGYTISRNFLKLNTDTPSLD